jgi:DNA-binding NarL/FixJ family response regulator
MTAKRVLIAEAHPMCASALSTVIRSLDASSTIARADSLADLRLALADRNFDLITLDLDLRDSKGLLTVLAVREAAPDIPVLVVSGVSLENLQNSLQNLGTKGYISKLSQMEAVGEAISAVLDGGTWFSAEIETEAGDGASSGRGRMSTAHMRVLRKMSEGHSNKEIAYRLGLAEQTVKTHVSAILRSLGVSNRSQAILMMREGARIKSSNTDD